MTTYIDQFNELARSQDSKYGVSDTKLWTQVCTESESQVDLAGELARSVIKSFCETPTDLIGKCFNISSVISIALCKAGIRHVFTVGDVKFKGTSYFNVTRDSLERSFSLGYERTKTLDAHAWITLSCGTVIDATIIPSIAYHKFGKHLKFIQSLYRSDLPTKYPIAHQPLLLGPMFSIRTNWEPSELAVLQAQKWIMSIDSLLDNQMRC